MERFWKKVDKEAEHGCWEWLGYVDDVGYGRYQVNKKLWLPHRYAWTKLKSKIPKGKLVCRRCSNKACVNPAHLFIGTHSDAKLKVNRLI